MNSFVFVIFTSLLTFSTCHVLLSSFDENDIGFLSNAADFLVSKGIGCTILIPDSLKELIVFDKKVKLLTFPNTHNNVNLLEDDWSDPVPSTEIEKQLKDCESLVQENKIIEFLINDPPTTVIFPSFLHDACLLPLVDYLNIRVVQHPNGKVISTLIWTTHYLSDSWSHYHVTSSLMPTNIDTGTYSRIKSFFNWWLFIREMNGAYVDPASQIMKSYLMKLKNYVADQSLPDLYENRVNLTLVATHPLFTPPTPLTLGISPITVNVGCFYCKSPNTLPKDLEEHISKHKTGTVLIDLDFKSNVPVDVKEAVIEASKLLPFSVNWQTHAWAKSVDRTPTNLSDNLLVRKSLPLQDILGHPKCRIFVSRCSMEMVLISTYHGVPLICLPVTHFDTSVASYVEKHGIGVILPRKNITGRHLYNAISGVTNDLSFRGIARHLAETLRDQPETPGDRFIFAIESLERHRDHNHYSHLKKQNFFNTHYWDICMALMLAGTVFMLFASFVIWFVYTKFSSNEQIITVNNKKII